MGKAFMIVILIGVALVVGYLGLSVWSSCQGPATGPDMPLPEKATHEFYLENTGGAILSSNFRQLGQVKGERVFELTGYWEMSGKSYKYVDNINPLRLDEKIFGTIKVTRRTK